MWLERASKRQKKIINNIFKSNIEENFTEIIFSPEFKFTWPGEKNNFIGLIDARLSNNFGLFAWLARQKSYKCCKNY